MKLMIGLAYTLNLMILLTFYMYMFQLNSYSTRKYIYWINKNKKKVLISIFLIIIVTSILTMNHPISNVIGIGILIFSIYDNFPKKKMKIEFKITNRVKRMYFTEIMLVVIIMGYQSSSLYIKMGMLNISASIICIVVNFINMPIECMIRNIYIQQAKKIIQNMPNLIVIGITGSYGKTSVKNFLKEVLSEKYEVLITPKNYNTTMGVVKTIREELKPIHQVFICEMGATKRGDIREICDIVKPKMGLITAIGPQHLESFKSIENIVRTKLELAEAVKKNKGVMFLNFDNEYLAKQLLDMQVISYGIDNEQLDYNGYHLKSSSKGVSFKVEDKVDNTKEVEIKTKLIGKHNVVNIMAAIAVADYLEIPIKKVQSCIGKMKGVEHRLQLLRHGNMTIIDDSYNANPISAKSALDTLGEFEGSKIIITPGLVELGKDERKYNFELGQDMASICDEIFLVGYEFSRMILEGIYSKKFDKKKIFLVNSPQEAIKKIMETKKNENVTVLLENDLPDNYNI